MGDQIIRVAQCRVCGQLVTGASCACSECQTIAHPECFAYAGGCSIFGCGTMTAHFPGEPPADWRADVGRPGVWLIPVDAVPVEHRIRFAPDPIAKCLCHWRTTAQLELFSVMGQAWFSTVGLVASLAGRWALHPALVAALACVVAAHLWTLVGLVRLGFLMTAPVPDGEAIDGRALRAVASRRASILQSRRLHFLGSLLFVAGMAVGGHASQPSWGWSVVLFSAMVPWFSLAPRWDVESSMLERADTARMVEVAA